MDNETREVYRGILSARLDALQTNSLDRAGPKVPADDGPGDAADLASAEISRSFQVSLRQREAVLIKKIEAALGRLEGDDFGSCLECGDEISEPRLRARPFTTLCIACKEEAERNGGRGPA